MACLLANNCITSHTMKKAHFNIQLHFFNKAIQTAESTPSLPACKPLFPRLEIHFSLNPHRNMIQTSYKALWLADEPHSSKTCVKPLVSTAQPISTTWFGQLTTASSLAVLLSFPGHDTRRPPLALLLLLLLLLLRYLLTGVQGTGESTAKNTTALCKKTPMTTMTNNKRKTAQGSPSDLLSKLS